MILTNFSSYGDRVLFLLRRKDTTCNEFNGVCQTVFFKVGLKQLCASILLQRGLGVVGLNTLNQCCHSVTKKNPRIYLEKKPENNKKPQTYKMFKKSQNQLEKHTTGTCT